jgi:hypothetical protein
MHACSQHVLVLGHHHFLQYFKITFENGKQIFPRQLFQILYIYTYSLR